MAQQFRRQTQGQTSPLEIQFKVLREELDNANKKVDRYANLIATLSEELDNLRRIICHNCKKKFVPSYSLVSSSDGPRLSLWRRIVSGSQTNSISPGLPFVFPQDEGESLTTVLPITAPQNQANTTILASPQASSSSSPMPQTPTTSNPADWSVAYNPKVKQAIHIGLVKTFRVISNVYCVKFSPDGKYLAVGVISGKTYIYDVEKRLEICCLADHTRKYNRIVWNIQFSQDSQYVATAGADCRIRVWEIARKRTIFILRQGGAATIYSTSFSPDGRCLVSGDATGLICKWRIRDGHLKVLMPRDYVRCVSVNFSPNGRYIASVHMNGFLRIWDARTDQLVYKWMGHTKRTYCLAFTPDGKGLVSGSEDKTLKYWNTISLVLPPSSQRLLIDGTPGGKFEQIRHFEGHTGSIRSAAASPDNQWVVTSSQDQTVRIWDTRAATLQCTLHGHTSYVRAVDFSPAGKYVASGCEDGHVRLWSCEKAGK